MFVCFYAIRMKIIYHKLVNITTFQANVHDITIKSHFIYINLLKIRLKYIAGGTSFFLSEKKN